MSTRVRSTLRRVLPRRFLGRSLLLAGLLSLPLVGLVRAGWNVWTVSETRHILRSEPPARDATVKLGAARNEWVSFQILLRSDAPLNGVRVDAGDLRGPGGASLGWADARLYRQHQLHLDVGTYRNDDFKPDWYPDPLIPFQHPMTRKRLEGARLTAVPFDLPANETHGFWVDLHVPVHAVPGEYRGVYRVTAGSGSASDLPVSLTVWDFALPETPALVTEFGSPRLHDYYRQQARAGNEPEPSDWAAVEAQCAQLLSEHRFNAVPPGESLTPKLQPDGSFRITPPQVQALREFVDRYHLNALQTPHPSTVVKDPEAERGTLRAWLAAFDQAARELDRPGLLFYTYLKDEPNTLEDYRYVQQWGRAVREAKSVVNVLVVEQPWTEPGQGGADSAWGDLYGAVDIWCPLFSLHRQESAARRQARGETIWTYTALCQGPPTPWWHIDFPLLNYRVPAWMAWRDGMKGLLYWGGMSYWRQSDDPWTTAPFYTGSGRPQQGEKGIVFQGEGSLVYPARAVGYDGVVPTIRLKVLRDAVEDYDYLAILRRLGKTAEAQQVVRSLTETFFQWQKDPAAYETARAKLAAMIVAAAETPPAANVRAEPAGGRSAWFPFVPVKDDFTPTILDGSSFVEAPTGGHGFVTVQGDRFAFEDGTPVRFWGAQVGLWGKEEVDYAVRRMRRQGINVTRLHGLEFLNARQGRTSLDYSAEGFDRLDYLISRLGENGIYLILDVHYPLTFRFKAGDDIPGLPEGGPAPYTQFFNTQVAALMHRRMTDVFTHLNPYTNKRYGDDPTLALVEVLNEDSLFWGGGVPVPFRAELEEQYAAWLRQHYGDEEGLRKAWTVEGKLPLADGEGLGAGQRVGLLRNTDFTEKFFRARPEQQMRGRDQLRFCLELEEKYWAGSVAAMRQAGVKVPISGSNWQGHGFTTRVHMLGQAQLDYIDRHGYWDHPQGEGNLKWRIATARFHNLPMVKALQPNQDSLTYLGVGNLVTEKAWEQVLGKPTTISEWNTCLPNEYSLEGTGLMAAYGLLQGWDASLEFGYFSPDWRDGLGGGAFDLLGNPPQILQFPAVSAMWHRGDVREAELVAESLYTPETVLGRNEDRKPAPIAAALVGKVGYRFVEQDRVPLVRDIGAYFDPTNLVARSVTQDLVWDGKQGFVRINTPRTQAVIGFLSAEPHVLKDVRFVSSTRFGALYVTAMDGSEPIATARRLLVTAVGPARNTGMEYETTTEPSRLGVPYSRLKQVGTAPTLLEAVSGELRIRSSRSREFKAWKLNLVGRRMQELPVSAEAGEIILRPRPEHETVYYELGI